MTTTPADEDPGASPEHDPLALCPGPHPGVLGASRRLEVFGRGVVCCLLPGRRQRIGARTAGQSPPPIRPDRVDGILERETLWTDPARGLALTPNVFPFAARHALLWTTTATREPTAAQLLFGHRAASAGRCVAMWNSVGAAASIPRAHVHLVEPAPDLAEVFLAGSAWRPAPWLAECLGSLADGLGTGLLDLPVPVLALRGPADRRAAATGRILLLRTSPAANWIAWRDTTWIVPRSAVEVPVPHYPYAVGCAELAGRWCFADEEPFASVGADDLEAALRAVTLAPDAIPRG